MTLRCPLKQSGRISLQARERGEGRVGFAAPTSPRRLEPMCITPNRLEIQLTHAQDSRRLILVGLRQRAVVVVDVDAAPHHIVH